MPDFPALNSESLPPIAAEGDAPRFLLLFGSLREGSFSRSVVEEAARLLERLGGEVRIFQPEGLPMTAVPGGPPHLKVAELCEAFLWSDAQIWCSPEMFGTLSTVMKAQLEALPPVVEGKHLFSGKPLATIQVCGGGPGYNTAGTLATVGRWLGMFVTPTFLCVPHVQTEFDESRRMKRSPHYDRLVDLCEELCHAALALRSRRAALLDHYSARQPK